MKKFILLFALVSLLLASCEKSQQSRISNNELSIIPFSNDNLRFGLVDLRGNIIVDNEWERTSSIAMNGIVSVKNKDGNFEFFTATSNPKKIGNVYKEVTSFSEGLAAVVNEQGFVHYIDTKGIIKFELPDDGKGSPIQTAGAFSEGLARFQNSENLWGFINTDGIVVIKPRYDYVRSFKEGLALVERYNTTTNEKSIGFINKQDIEVIPLTERYTAFSDFSEGLASCTDKDTKNQWGYINKKGDKVIEINKLRVKVMPFHGGFATFYDGSYWGMINKEGDIVVNPKYDGLFASNINGLAPYKNSSNEIGFINTSRKDVIDCKYEEVLPFFSKTTVVKDKYYIFIDKQGDDVSETYLKHININNIVMQFTNITNDLIKNQFINANNITDAIISSISETQINGLSFNSSVRDAINSYKISRSKLPRNSYQKYIQNEISLTGNIDPYKVKIYFNENILNADGGQINERARIKAIEFTIYTRSLDSNQIESIITRLKSKCENAKFTFDSDASNSSWKPNTSIYKFDRSKIELSYSSSEIHIKIDYSEYF